MILRITIITTIGFVMAVASKRDRKRTEEPADDENGCFGLSLQGEARDTPEKLNPDSANLGQCYGLIQDLTIRKDIYQQLMSMKADNLRNRKPTIIDLNTNFWDGAKSYIRKLFKNDRRSNIQHSWADGGPGDKKKFLGDPPDKLAADLEILEALKKIVENKLQELNKE